MNLREIIRESINSVLLDSIISEEILHEASRATRGRYAGNRQANRYTGNRQQPNNLQQKRQQNVRQTNQSQQAASTPTQNAGVTQVAPQNNAGTAQQPQQGQQQPQQTTPQAQEPQSTQQPQQATPQGQQQAAADFSQYADELRRLIGNSGFDATPVENNQAATQHIEKLNQFVYAVINAIDNGNINTANSAAAGGGTSYSRWGKPYSKDGVDVAMDATNGIVGFTTDTAEKMLGQGANNPFNGVFKAGGDAYKKTKGDIANYMNQKKYVDSYGNSTTPQGANGGTDLTYLMQSIDEGCYPRLQSEYNQINQETNGIFSATPNVSNCHEVLRSLASAVTNYNNNQKQATQQQQSGQQKPQQVQQGQEQQPVSRSQNPTAKLERYANGLKILDRDGTALGEEYEQYKNTPYIARFIGYTGELSEMCINAIENNIIYSRDYKNDGNYSLAQVMGFGNERPHVDYQYLYPFYNASKDALPQDTVTMKIFNILGHVYQYVESNNIR
jgi:hypothetical protein